MKVLILRSEKSAVDVVLETPERAAQLGFGQFLPMALQAEGIPDLERVKRSKRQRRCRPLHQR
ncbi:MAG: hypothetical protein DMG07_27180 [Acidobacteria bacterium]|nr:MAG: hypothetical protein DMG07_27180 [Acidobacteriota bacterium]